MVKINTYLRVGEVIVENIRYIFEISIPVYLMFCLLYKIYRGKRKLSLRDYIFEFVFEIRKDITIPLVFMTYANVVFSYGSDRFAKRCQDTGIEGLILPDVPFEENLAFFFAMSVSFSGHSQCRTDHFAFWVANPSDYRRVEIPYWRGYRV